MLGVGLWNLIQKHSQTHLKVLKSLKDHLFALV